MGTQGRNTSCLGVQGNAGYSCPAEGLWPKGTGMELPWVSLSSSVLCKPQCSQPHSSSWPVGTCPHSALVGFSQEKNLGRFWTEYHRTHKQTHPGFP